MSFAFETDIVKQVPECWEPPFRCESEIEFNDKVNLRHVKGTVV